jgi:hypothetical protein
MNDEVTGTTGLDGTPGQQEREPVLEEPEEINKLRIVLKKTADWLKDNSNVLIAVFTIVVATSTVVNTCTSCRIGRMANRAYVVFGEIGRTSQGSYNGMEVYASFVNIGRTPAYKVACRDTLTLARSSTEAKSILGSVHGGTWFIGAGDSLKIPDMRALGDSARYDSLNTERWHIYSVIKITYRDIFGVSRYVTSCHRYTDVYPDYWVVADDGNDAN